MKKRYDIVRFALKCILIPAAAVLIIYRMNRAYLPINDQKYLDLDKFIYYLGDDHGKIRVANLGSSHGAYDFIYDNITEQGNVCFNFGLPSQSYEYDYALLKEYGHYMENGSVMLIPVSYFSFNNEVTNAEEEQALSVRYYRILSPENIPNYSFYKDIITHKFPILSAGEDILQLFPDLNAVLTAHAANDGIDLNEFIERAQARYSRHFDNKEEYFLPERIENLYDIIDYCKNHDITPVLITTPFSIYYNDLVPQDFLQEFYATIGNISHDTSVNYYDYSHDERFYDNLEYFSDSDHLNETGALYFTDMLWDEVEELGRFH